MKPLLVPGARRRGPPAKRLVVEASLTTMREKHRESTVSLFVKPFYGFRIQKLRPVMVQPSCPKPRFSFVPVLSAACSRMGGLTLIKLGGEAYFQSG